MYEYKICKVRPNCTSACTVVAVVVTCVYHDILLSLRTASFPLNSLSSVKTLVEPGDQESRKLYQTSYTASKLPGRGNNPTTPTPCPTSEGSKIKMPRDGPVHYDQSRRWLNIELNVACGVALQAVSALHLDHSMFDRCHIASHGIK